MNTNSNDGHIYFHIYTQGFNIPLIMLTVLFILFICLKFIVEREIEAEVERGRENFLSSGYSPLTTAMIRTESG